MKKKKRVIKKKKQESESGRKEGAHCSETTLISCCLQSWM